jgi:DnaK suppressor protein
MDEGEYGFCTECGEDIATKRLELDPTLPTCINCARG